MVPGMGTGDRGRDGGHMYRAFFVGLGGSVDCSVSGGYGGALE